MQDMRVIFPYFFVSLLVVCVSQPILGQSTAFEKEINEIAEFFKTKMKARYMEKECVDSTYPNWEGFPLKKCSYSVKGRNEKKPKTAQVVLLNAPPRQLARWVVSTCLEMYGNVKRHCSEALNQRIISQSGAQFPIAGIVYEDLNDDGVYEVYVFRDGVTVVIDEIRNGETKYPTDDQLTASLFSKATSTGKFARIQGTTRQEYKKNAFFTKEKYPVIFQTVYGNQVVEVGDNSDRRLIWLDVVRNLYKAAWGKDRNELLISWARSNASQLDATYK